LQLYQPARGYRFSVDAPILADFVISQPADQLLEIGTGCGIIPLILFHKKRFRHLVAVEIQPELAALADRNFRLNATGRRLEVRAGDIRDPRLQASLPVADIVFANPPYRSLGRGKLNPDSQKAIARHELRLSPPELLAAAMTLLQPEGRLFLIHLPEREPELLQAAATAGFHLHRRRLVFSLPESPLPKLVLLHFGRRPARAESLSPLCIYEKEKRYSEEFRTIISART